MSVRTGVAVLAAVLAALVVPGIARAEERPPAIDQYVEQIPTSSGSQATGQRRPTGRRATGRAVGGGGGTTATEAPGGVVQLPAAVERRLAAEGGRDAALLRRIATAPELGAPEDLRVDRAQRARVREVRRDAAEQPVPAAVGAVAETGDGRVLALVIAMGVMTALALAAAGRRRRGVRSSGSR